MEGSKQRIRKLLGEIRLDSFWITDIVDLNLQGFKNLEGLFFCNSRKFLAAIAAIV
jgi:hypothetical protein